MNNFDFLETGEHLCGLINQYQYYIIVCMLEVKKKSIILVNMLNPAK